MSEVCVQHARRELGLDLGLWMSWVDGDFLCCQAWILWPCWSSHPNLKYWAEHQSRAWSWSRRWVVEAWPGSGWFESKSIAPFEFRSRSADNIPRFPATYLHFIRTCTAMAQVNHHTVTTSLEPVYLSSPSPSDVSQAPAQQPSGGSPDPHHAEPSSLVPPSHLDTGHTAAHQAFSPHLPGQSAPAPFSPPLKTQSVRPPRLRKGTRLEDAYPSVFAELGDRDPDPLTLLATLESPFQVQEYIAQLVRADPHNVLRIIKLPMHNSAPLVQREVWVYEQLRRLADDLGHPLVSSLQAECNRAECPEMKAGEWLYLCAAHATANENECCAIDYIVHTLDGATALLNSARYFPSRLQIPTSSIKHFTSIARRLYRILAHAWFHHREVFEQCETEKSLYARFLALTDEFGLIAEDLLVIPREKDQEDEDVDDQDDEGAQDDDDDEDGLRTADEHSRTVAPTDEEDELEETKFFSPNALASQHFLTDLQTQKFLSRNLLSEKETCMYKLFQLVDRQLKPKNEWFKKAYAVNDNSEEGSCKMGY
ncbi:hypothetical protein O181_015768 [Austropuccinia psidii MF-1]|uniref:Mob1/phocein n=1 Tax=Austropuccinia psidii MF-1 TaxID=1389203 RepID=A0A9Q3C3U6_9BASI|nr:hypothetical protein [Austropuccinia psidii MF-1]